MIKRFSLSTIFFSICFFSFAQSFQRLEKQFAVSPVLSQYYYGFALYDLSSNKVVFGKNQHNHFTPASNTKVFTLYESLTHLGDSLVGIEYIERGDSLYFWGTGDPTFLHPELNTQKVFDFLKNSNKTLVYVPQETQEPTYREGWSIEDYDFYYQPEVSAFPIYGNVVHFELNRGSVQIRPIYFRERIEWAPSSKATRISRSLRRNKYKISGKMSNNYQTDKPFIYSDSLFVKLLADTLQREVNLTTVSKPVDVKQLNSVSTREVLREMMLPSDNFLAEHLQMSVAYQLFDSFHTKDFRMKMQKEYDDILPDKIQLRDASGLSIYNKITPASMVELLQRIYKANKNEEEVLELFPAGGIEGTLKGVYPLDQNKPFVWAKTGTIHAVHAQSGFIKTKKGKMYAFSFLNNNYLGSSIPVRNEMVRIMTFIHDNF